MRFIARANLYSRSPGALAEFLGITRGTASQTLIALENKGFLRRVKGGADRRAVQLELTEQGQMVLRRDPIGAIEQAAAGLDPEVAGNLVRGLSRLLHDLQDRYAIKPFGICADCSLFCVTAQQRAAGQVERPAGAPPVCGMTGDILSTKETGLLCVNYRAN